MRHTHFHASLVLGAALLPVSVSSAFETNLSFSATFNTNIEEGRVGGASSLGGTIKHYYWYEGNTYLDENLVISELVTPDPQTVTQGSPDLGISLSAGSSSVVDTSWWPDPVYGTRRIAGFTARANAGVTSDTISMSLMGGYMNYTRLIDFTEGDIFDGKPAVREDYRERLFGSGRTNADVVAFDPAVNPNNIALTAISSKLEIDYTVGSIKVYDDYWIQPGDGGSQTYEEEVGDPATMFVVSHDGVPISRGLVGVNLNGGVFEAGDVLATSPSPSGSLVYDLNLDLASIDLSSGSGFSAETTSFIPGDFNNDSEVDAVDIDLLADRASDDPQVLDALDLYDLETDWTVTFSDLVASDASFLVREVLDTEFGDANLDGVVNLTDFGILNANFGAAGGWAEGDFDGDGTVGLTDFGIIRAYFGFGGPASLSAMASTLTIPEPTSAAGLSVLVGLSLTRRRKRIVT
ncbi:MAG: PEP-CTERM sorting domain-containing protein [Planctomycetota bacterium]